MPLELSNLTANAAVFKGSGTAAEPYQISSADDLRKLSDLINDESSSENYLDRYYIQTADIDLNNEPFTPIGICQNENGDFNYNLVFCGVYDGNYHSVLNLSIESNENNYMGLFGRLCRGEQKNDCIIKNLSGTKDDPFQISNKEELKNMRDLVNSDYFNQIYGRACYIQTSDIDLENEEWIPIGLGQNDSEKGIGQGDYNYQTRMFKGSYDGNNHYIKNLNIEDNWIISGLFAYLRDAATLKNLVVYGDVKSANANSAGGLVGQLQYYSKVENCAFIGDINGGVGAGSGGICGDIWQAGTILNCYHNGSVKAQNSAGGIVGAIRFGQFGKDGDKAVVENCYQAKSCRRTGSNLQST